MTNINTSPNLDAILPVDAYARGSTTGKATHRIVSTSTTDSAEEKYTLFVGTYDNGSGDGTVPGSSYALGLSAIKDDWGGTTHPGQMHGVSIVTRGGFHGQDINQSYNPGDTASIVVNSFVSSRQSFSAGLEGVSGYCKDGNYVPNPSDPVRQIRFQIGAVRAKDNPGIGYLAIADAGPLGAAFQAQNKLNYSVGAGTWSHFLKYIVDFGSGAWEAFSVNQQGWLRLSNMPTSLNPLRNKMIRVGGDGFFEIIGHNGQTIPFRLDDKGNIHLPAGAGVYVGGVKKL